MQGQDTQGPNAAEPRTHRVRVMHLISVFALGGAEKLVYDIAGKTDRTRFEVSVCSVAERGDALERTMRRDLEQAGFPTFCLAKPYRTGRLRAVANLRRILRDNRIEVLNTHCQSPDFYGRLAARLAGTPAVCSTIHNTQGYSRLLETVFKHLTGKYVAISERVQQYMQSALAIPGDKLRVIPNGIAVEKYDRGIGSREAKLAELGIDPARRVITNTARLAEQKGQIFLLEAVKEVTRRHPDAHFLIVGDENIEPACAEKLKRYAREQGIQEHVTFTGIRTDVPELLAASDLCVFPSLFEGLSIAILETLAMGLPTVATDVGSIREVIEHGRTGIIIPPGSARAISDSLCSLLEDGELAAGMGLRAREHIAANYSITGTASGYEQLYLDLLAGAAGRRPGG